MAWPTQAPGPTPRPYSIPNNIKFGFTSAWQFYLPGHGLFLSSEGLVSRTSTTAPNPRQNEPPTRETGSIPIPQNPSGLWRVQPRPRPPGGRFTLALSTSLIRPWYHLEFFFIRRILVKNTPVPNRRQKPRIWRGNPLGLTLWACHCPTKDK